MKWIYAALLIVCITLLLMHGAVRLEESFASANVPIDIPAYLKALEEYNTLYETTCRAGALDQRCSMYKVPTKDYKSFYMPPIMSTSSAFSNKVVSWNGSGELPPLSVNDFGDIMPLSEPLNTQKIFVYYTAFPSGNTRFINNTAENKVLTPWEVWLNNQVNVARSGVAPNVVYNAYFNITGKGSYKFTKVFVGENNAETPIHTLYLVDSTTGQRHGLGYTNSGAIRGVKGTVLENNDGALELLLSSANQAAFNLEFDQLTAVPVVASSSAVPVVASSSSALPVVAAARASGGTGEVLDLPELTYYEDAWFRNRALFAKMFGSVQVAVAEVKSYAQTAGAGTEGQTYELTALKFLELDRLILKSATSNGVVNVRALQGYNLEVPFPYDPAMYDINNTMEEPSRSPIGLKCYDLSEVQRKIIAYLSSRSYESATMTNLQLLAKYRTNLCASYGYYSKDGVASCKCEGCCIPVDYKTTFGRRTGRTGQATTNVNAAAMEAAAKKELGSADEDKCVHFNRPYRLKRRQLPVGVDEEDVCLKEGFSESGITTRTFTTDVGAAKATAGLMKGWRFFQQRMVPAYLDGEGFEGADECLTPSLPSPYRLQRGKPKFMTCG